ncbi:SCO family protein [Flavisolibacter ginsenosidimutans]|uniref:SCO family protein n=1 Tax=Flavisolibacter ginsenosidimutans TaxID=661481 RepID=A0A5B8ULQ9_9BACT|nr:SCO family protein [Flavisolibacter ginsenosidimutans]QEC57376.1 SCO family protein [Flavisolibacter ginsenosidimutans]
MNKTALYGLLIGVFIPVMAYFVMKFIPVNEMPHRLFVDSIETKIEGGKETMDTIWHKVPDFTLTNQLGQKVSWKDLKGKIVVADFFFTRCPVICPQMTRNMKRLQDAVKNNNKAGSRDADFVQFISFSVDPTHDSVPELKKFADRFQINPENWWLLTGDKKQIYDLALNGMKLGIDTTEVDTAFIHPQKFVLIDKDRVLRSRRDEFGNVRLYNGLDSNDVKNIAEDIILLSLEKDKHKKFPLVDELPLIGVVMGIAVILITLMMVLFKKKQNL